MGAVQAHCLGAAAAAKPVCLVCQVIRRACYIGVTANATVHSQVDYVNPTTPSPSVVTAKVMTGAPVTTSGVKIGAPMDLTGLYAVPVKITNASRSTVRHCTRHCIADSSTLCC